MNRAAAVAGLVAVLAWGVWYVRHSHLTGEAPGPPFGFQRSEHPVIYWFLMITYIGILLGGAWAAISLALEG